MFIERVETFAKLIGSEDPALTEWAGRRPEAFPITEWVGAPRWVRLSPHDGGAVYFKVSGLEPPALGTALGPEIEPTPGTAFEPTTGTALGPTPGVPTELASSHAVAVAANPAPRTPSFHERLPQCPPLPEATDLPPATFALYHGGCISRGHPHRYLPMISADICHKVSQVETHTGICR